LNGSDSDSSDSDHVQRTTEGKQKKDQNTSMSDDELESDVSGSRLKHFKKVWKTDGLDRLLLSNDHPM